MKELGLIFLLLAAGEIYLLQKYPGARLFLAIGAAIALLLAIALAVRDYVRDPKQGSYDH